MRALLQRVKWARVLVEGDMIGAIERGLLILLGVARGDSTEDAQLLACKAVDLRIFEDGDGKMNRSLREEEGSILVVSQFTLHADCRKGRRPFFGAAEEPAAANALCQVFIETLRGESVDVATGRFGAMMQVELCNDGPVTILLDSADLGASLPKK